MTDRNTRHDYQTVETQSRSGDSTSRLAGLAKLLASLIELPDAALAASAACALVAAELGDAGLVLGYRATAGACSSEIVLADYPSGIGLADVAGAETISVPIANGAGVGPKSSDIRLLAWRSRGDRQFNPDDQELLSKLVPQFKLFVDRLVAGPRHELMPALDPETGLWSLPRFFEQADRRFDRLDIEGRVGTMFAFGWVRSDGAATAEASAIVIKESVACLQEMLRPIDLLGRVGPTRLAAWCDGVDHLIAAERGDRIVSRLESLLAGSGRHAAIGIASRWPQSGDDPATLLARSRAGLEQARLKAATLGRPVVRIWQPAD